MVGEEKSVAKGASGGVQKKVIKLSDYGQTRGGGGGGARNKRFSSGRGGRGGGSGKARTPSKYDEELKMFDMEMELRVYNAEKHGKSVEEAKEEVAKLKAEKRSEIRKKQEQDKLAKLDEDLKQYFSNKAKDSTEPAAADGEAADASTPADANAEQEQKTTTDDKE